MNSCSLKYKWTGWLAACLIGINPLLHASSSIAAVKVEQESTNKLSYSSSRGTFSNGFSYTLIAPENIQNMTWLRLTVRAIQEPEERAITTLMHQASLYKTATLNREEIVNKLNGWGLDIDADSHFKSYEIEQQVQFLIPAANLETLDEALVFLQQLVLYPTLDEEAVELARQHLMEKLSADNSIEAEKLRQQIESVTVAQVQDFHAKWYRPDLMHLALVGPYVGETAAPIIAKHFDFEASIAAQEDISPSLRLAQLQNKSLIEEEDTFLLQTIGGAQQAEGNTVAIDGKILMKEASGLNKSINGRLFGAFLTIVGIAGLLVAAPIAAPAALIASGFSAVTGIYLMSCSYLKDPSYVKAKRQEDLAYGFEYAYQRGRAGITLTPCERRALFLQEMVQQPHILSKEPILLLADLYQLNDSTCSAMFYPTEIDVLQQIKRDFILERNQIKRLMNDLDSELYALTYPYAVIRDVALQQAYDAYNQNYYVVTKEKFKQERDRRFADIEHWYQTGQISLSQKEDYIRQERGNYEMSLNTVEMRNGLSAAESSLSLAKLDIQAAYLLQVEICKQTINYNDRMAQYKQGLNYVKQHFGEQLYNVLLTFPAYDQAIPDFLDLRY